MSNAEQANLIPGSMVGGFRVEEFVGAGAMAVVYRATQINLDRSVALKILPRDFSRDRDYVDRFFNEARAAAAFSHPNIVRAYDADIDKNDVCYFAMEFIKGETIEDRIKREGRLPLLDALQIALDIAKALNYGWHEHQLTHGDIKPANLMINQQGETKLADFGLAKVADFEDVQGSIMLTPLYASPEAIQGRHEKRDCRPDIYSFGATFYHMVSGAPPFPGEDSDEVMRHQIEKPLTPLHKRCPDIPRHVSDLISFLLKKDPEDRAQSWEQVVAELEKSLALLTSKGGVVTAKATPAKPGNTAHKKVWSITNPKMRLNPARKKSRWAGIAALLALTAVVIIVAGVMIFHSLNQTPEPEEKLPGTDVKLPAAQMPKLSRHIQWRQLNNELKGQEEPAKRLVILRKYLLLAVTDADKRHLHKLIINEQDKLIKETDNHQTPKEKPPEPSHASDTIPPGPPVVIKDQPAHDQSLSPKRKNQALDAYTNVLFTLRRQNLSFAPISLSIKQAIKDWLATYSTPLLTTQKTTFLDTVLLPAHDQLTACLIENTALFEGQTIPGRKDKIHAITLDGVDTILPLDGGGKVHRGLTWAAVSSPPVVKWFVKRILAKQDITDAELRTVLSCIALDGAVSSIKNISGTLPEGEPQLWVAVTTDLANAQAEKNAGNTLAQAEQAVKDGAFLTAYSLMNNVISSGTSIATRYEDRLDTIKREVLPHTPEKQVGDLVKKADSMLMTQPREALSLAIMSVGKYGHFNSPAIIHCKDLLTGAVNQISSEIQTRGAFAHFDSQFSPFLPSSSDEDTFGESLGVIQGYSQLGSFPENINPYQKPLYTVAWLANAYWQQAMSASPVTPPDGASTLSPPLKFDLIYADALILARETPRRTLLKQRLTDLHEYTLNAAEWLTQATLSLQYAYLIETSGIAVRLTWPQVNRIMLSTPLGQDYIFSLAALYLTNKDVTSANNILQMASRYSYGHWPIPGPGNDFEGTRGPSQKRRAIRWLSRCLSGAFSTPVTRPIHGEVDDFDTQRLHTSCKALMETPSGRWVLNQLLSVENVLNQDVRNDIISKLADPKYIRSILDARRVVDNLLHSTATFLKAGNLENALVALDTVLDNPSPFLVEYYPRVLALKAGVLMLAKKPAMAQETLAMIQFCTAANQGEKQWVTYLSAPSSHLSPDMPPQAVSLTDYWTSWLHACYWQGKGKPAVAKRETLALSAMSTSEAKSALAEGLAAWPPANKN